MPSILLKILETKKQEKTSTKSKVLDFGKMIADQARSQGLLPRTYLEQLCSKSESFAKSNLVKILMGEQDVPQQKGRDAKPEVLTKRAMNTVKKGIKQAANKQRRRMDKDAVKEDGKDEFSKHVNPMGSDSVAMAKIKKSPGFYDMLVTFYTSAVLHDRDDDEVLPIMSSMFNMNVEEIKAVLRQYGKFTFGGSSPEDKFKTNMKATGFLGKGKSRTLNSKYEDQGDNKEEKIKAWAAKYEKYMGGNADTLPEGFLEYMMDTGVATDSIEAGEIKKYAKKYGDDAVGDLGMDQIHENPEEFPITNSFLEDLAEIFGHIPDQDEAEEINKVLGHFGEDSMNEDEHQDRGYAQMIIQQNPQEYKKFMDTGDLMDAPTIYEKLFAYFSSSDASDMMPYGTQKARDGDPYVWLTDKLDELGLTEGNEFAQKVRQMKAAGAKKGTKFKTSDGEEHTLEQVSKKTIDNFHTELDRLVHKYFGHSSDEKKEKVKEDDDKGEVMVGSYQTKHFDICPSATRLYKDIDVEDMDLAERSAKLHDTLFYMEKHAQEMKEADPEYIEMMQNLADQIMAMAGMMGLESEHSYVQGHVDAVKNLGESVESVEAITEEEFDEAAGEKDACYHKVKSRYKVWPSAYASGALVKCRKVGASNWGNKSK